MMSKKLFDFVIGNPPFNEDFANSGENGNYAKPVYNLFMDASYKVADKVELIHLSRFLFNAGSTPKSWNKKMLNDPHFKVLKYVDDASKVFSNTDIKGGVAITYRDVTKNFGAIGIFLPYPELKGIVHKCSAKDEQHSLASIIHTQMRFDLDSLYKDYPKLKKVIGSNGKDRRFRNNIFTKVPVFTESPKDEDDIKVIGVIKNKRVWRYIPKKYVDQTHENLGTWKTIVPRANGSGNFGEILSSPFAIGPLIGYTQTFIGIGAFNNKIEAEALLKYIKTKISRTLLDILKVTQDNDRGVWKLVPLQDFTENSDIDWSKSVHDIDLQLYKKYGLNDDEINFIETHVKEMA